MVSPRTVPSQVWTSSKLRWASAVLAGSVASLLMPGTSSTQRDRPMTWTAAAATPRRAIQRPRLPPARRPSRIPARASRAALITSTRNQAVTAPWCRR
jgi:hypothetical protein